MKVGVATTNRLAADGGAEVARAGGNAIDVAIAAVLVSMVSEPGMVSLAGGGFLSIWPEVGDPVTIDGGVAMPGRGSSRRPGDGAVERVLLEYAGGVETTIGYGSVAVPGILAALELASIRYGRLPWRELCVPARAVAREGFPLSSAAHRFMMDAHEHIYGWDPRSRRALHEDDGRLKAIGRTIEVAHLADSVAAIGEEGTAVFYKGALAARIADHVQSNGGLLTREDLAHYEAVIREPVTLTLDGWTVATAPPPSLGGPVLGAMLRMYRGTGDRGWGVAETDELIRVQIAALAHRFEVLDLSDELEQACERMLELAPGGPEALHSPSTVHTSAADAAGGACAITASAGYGSGVIPPGTGIWLNNALGELELNRRGIDGWAPGDRLYSNMAPTVARSADGTTLAIGSPGADRITTAQLQALLSHLRFGLSLEEAAAHPRLHVERAAVRPLVAFEPGLPVDQLPVRQRAYDQLDAFFGGVAAVSHHPDGRFELAADPRRAGAVALEGDP